METPIAASLTVPIAVPLGTRVDLTIEDGSNPPLDLTAIAAVLAPLPWIYFESGDGQPLVARFGDDTVSRPSYDLEAVRPTLTTLTTSTAAWGEATAAAPTAADVHRRLRSSPVRASTSPTIGSLEHFRPARRAHRSPAR